jgi:hypothetical protein
MAAQKQLQMVILWRSSRPTLLLLIAPIRSMQTHWARRSQGSLIRLSRHPYYLAHQHLLPWGLVCLVADRERVAPLPFALR